MSTTVPGICFLSIFPAYKQSRIQRAEPGEQHIYIRPTVMDSDAFWWDWDWFSLWAPQLWTVRAEGAQLLPSFSQTHTHTSRSRRHSVARLGSTDPPYPWKRSNADAGEPVIDFGLKEMWHAVMGYWLNQLRCMDAQGCSASKVNRLRPAFQRNPLKTQLDAEKLSKRREAMHLHHIPNMCNLQSWQQFCHVMTVLNYML